MTTSSLVRLALLCLVSACVAQAQPQPQPAYYAQPAQPYQPYPSGAGQPMAPAATGAQAPATTARRLTFNGVPANQNDLATLDALERQWGSRLPDGDYWYDPISGAAGYWGGPMIATIQAGLQLGGQLPANASGGGNGTLTGVFINSRELHPQDVIQLQALVGEVPMGRWWVDGQGNFGAEGGAMMGNLFALSQQRGGGNGGASSSTSSNGSVFTRGNCVQVTGSDGSTMSSGC